MDGISEIQLGTVIDFGTLQVGEENSFVCEIPLPNGVRNLSNVGNTAVEQAKVTVNLNGYREATVTVPQENIQITNAPSGREVEVTTQTLEVTLIGPEAQVMNITGDMVSVQADLTNYAQSTGIVEVPVSVTVSGSGADSCWVAGSYTANVNFQGADAALAAARRAPDSDDE